MSLKIATKDLGLDYDLELTSWPDGLNVYRIYNDGKRELVDENLGIDVNEIELLTGQQDWFKTIPQVYLDKVAPFNGIQHYMLWLAANSNVAGEILLGRPMILALLCKAYLLERQQALKVVNGGDEAVLQQLSLACDEDAFSFIDKLNLRFSTGSELGYVDEFLKADGAVRSQLKFHQQINDLLLMVAKFEPELLATEFAEYLSVVEVRNVWANVGIIRDAIRNAKLIYGDKAIEVVGNLASLDELKSLNKVWKEHLTH